MHLYLRCCAASFAQSLKLSEAIRSVAPPASLPKPTLQSAEAADAQQQRESADWRRRFESFYSADSCNDVVYEAWSEIVEEYLVAEREWVKTEMALVADKWEEDVSVCGRLRSQTMLVLTPLLPLHSLPTNRPPRASTPPS